MRDVNKSNRPFELVPLISVVVPTCNRIKELKRCLQSLQPNVQQLGSENYEIIVTDDGASESARQVIAVDFPSVRWIAGPQRGPASNRNHGVSVARGKWIVFVDDDCIPSPEFLMAYYNALGTALVLEGKTTSLDLPVGNPRYEAPVNLSGGCLYTCNLCVNKDLFVQLGGFDERFKFWCEDMDFRRRLADAGQRSAFIPDALVDHPSRRRPIGIAMGRRWYGIVDLWSSEHKSLTWWGIVSHVAKIRLGELSSIKLNLSNLTLALSMIPEICVVCMSATTWIENGKRLFASGSWPCKDLVEKDTVKIAKTRE